MKATILGFALLMSGTAIAQTTSSTDSGTMTEAEVSASTSSVPADATAPVPTDTTTTDDTGTMSSESTMSSDSSVQSGATATMDTSGQSSMTMATNMTPASGSTVQAGNTNPEKDARGVTVMSDAATVPAGWNGVGGSAVGGPMVDPSTGATVSADSYPACSASVTDNCVQSYERGRSRS